jgi:hypothetical protein
VGRSGSCLSPAIQRPDAGRFPMRPLRIDCQFSVKRLKCFGYASRINRICAVNSK